MVNADDDGEGELVAEEFEQRAAELEALENVGSD